MKPFAAIDLTADKKNETVNGLEFCCAKPSEALTRSFETSSEQVDETLNRAKLPLLLRIIKSLCGGLGLIVFISLLKGLGDVETLDEAYHNAGWLFWLCGGCLLAWGILKFISRKREKSVLETEDSEQSIARMNGLCEAIFSELSVPASAREADILTFYYKDKNGKLKHVTKGSGVFNYLNLVYRVYADEENLYIVNLDGKYAFPKASLKAIRTKKENAILASWNKDAPFNEGFYKQFKLQENQYGGIIIKTHHILELERNGETWGIYFPSYELPTFEVLTGLKAE